MHCDVISIIFAYYSKLNSHERSYQPILRYLYTEVKKRRGEISLHKHFKIEARKYKRCLVIYKEKSRRSCALFVPCLYRIVHFNNPCVHSALNCGLNARWSLGPRCLVVVRSCKAVQNCIHYKMLMTTSSSSGICVCY